jgi:hypothetical protein
MITFIPASAKAFAMPSPIPLAPPVMKAVFPLTSFMLVLVLALPPLGAS